MAVCSRSVSSLRLGKPVSASWKAKWRMASSASLRSVMSRAMAMKRSSSSPTRVFAYYRQLKPFLVAAYVQAVLHAVGAAIFRRLSEGHHAGVCRITRKHIVNGPADELVRSHAQGTFELAVHCPVMSFGTELKQQIRQGIQRRL